MKAGQPIGTLGGTGILNGGPHLHIGATSLGLLKAAVFAKRGAATEADDEDSHGKESDKTEMESMLDFTRAGGLANRRNIGAPRGGRYASTVTTGIDGQPGVTTTNPRPGGVARTSGVAIARDLLTDTPDLSGSIDTSPSGRTSLGIKRAGNDAAAEARRQNKKPEDVAAARKKAEDDALRGFYERQRALTDKRIKQVQAECRRLSNIIRSIRKSKKGTKAGRGRLISALQAEIRDWMVELGELRDVLAGFDEAILDLDGQVTDDQYATSYDGDGDGVPDSVEGGSGDPSADERAAAAEAREAVFRGRSEASGQILRGITGSGSIDPGAGGGGITVNVNVGGSLVTQQDVAGWLVGMLGNQPGSRRAAGTVGV